MLAATKCTAHRKLEEFIYAKQTELFLFALEDIAFLLRMTYKKNQIFILHDKASPLFFSLRSTFADSAENWCGRI